MKIHYRTIDLLSAYNVEYVRDQIVDKVSRLVIELLPSLKKTKEIETLDMAAHGGIFRYIFLFDIFVNFV